MPNTARSQAALVALAADNSTGDITAQTLRDLVVSCWNNVDNPGLGTGTVTSVNLTQPAAGITVSGGPVTSSGSITVSLANDLAAVEGLSSTGLAARTASDTWAVRTITGTSNQIDVANGSGAAGNPTLSLSASYVGQTSITTVGTIATGTWSGTTIALNKGGTGATTQAGAANAVLPTQTSNSGKYLTTDGSNVSWGTVASVSPPVTFTSPTAATVVLTLTGAASQSGDLMECKDSSGNVLSKIDSAGVLYSKWGAVVPEPDPYHGGYGWLNFKVSDGAGSYYNSANLDINGKFYALAVTGDSVTSLAGGAYKVGSANNGTDIYHGIYSVDHLDLWFKAANQTVGSFAYTGNFGVGTSTSRASSRLQVVNNDASQPVASFKGYTSQTAALTEWQDSTGAVVASVKNNGAIVPASLADASAANGTIYYSTDAAKLVYKDSGGTVRNLY